MRTFIVTALSLILLLGLPGSGEAQETSGDFSGGSIRIDYDSRTCDASLEGSIRYNSSASTAPSNGLLAHWEMDETSGSTIADSAGVNNGVWTDGANNDVAEETTTGQIGTALYFNNTGNSTITVTDDPDINPASDTTISAWFKIDAANGQGEQVIMLKGDGGTLDYVMGVNQPENSFRCATEGDFTGYIAAEDTGTTVSTGVFHLGVCVYDDANDEIRAYLDGVLTDTHTGDVFTTGSESGDLVFGQWNGGDYLNGDIDDVRIYNRALSAQEIEDLFTSCPVEFCDGAAWQPWCAGN